MNKSEKFAPCVWEAKKISQRSSMHDICMQTITAYIERTRPFIPRACVCLFLSGLSTHNSGSNLLIKLSDKWFRQIVGILHFEKNIFMQICRPIGMADWLYWMLCMCVRLSVSVCVRVYCYVSLGTHWRVVQTNFSLHHFLLACI